MFSCYQVYDPDPRWGTTIIAILTKLPLCHGRDLLLQWQRKHVQFIDTHKIAYNFHKTIPNDQTFSYLQYIFSSGDMCSVVCECLLNEQKSAFGWSVHSSGSLKWI